MRQVNITLSTGRAPDWQFANWERASKDGAIQREFWTRVQLSTDEEACWVWTGVLSGHNRYGDFRLKVGGQIHRIRAHRFSWMIRFGPIPDDMRVCHRCDNPLCVRPDHLFLGTQAENVHDSARKGRKNAWGIQKLDASDVYQIRARVAAGHLQQDVAKAFGIARNTVSGIVHRKSWAHLPPATEAGVYECGRAPVHVGAAAQRQRRA